MPTPTNDTRQPGRDPLARPGQPAGPDRRTLVAGIAAGGLALPLLAACGSGGGSGDATGTTGSSEGSDPSSGGSGGGLAKTTAIPVGGGKIFDSERVVVTQPTKGEFKAFSAVCTHQGCLVTQVSNGLIQCPCHGSEYSISDGSVKAGPAPRSLPTEQITVTNGEIKLA